MTRCIGILLSLIMALSLVPMSVFASETIQSVVVLGIDEPVDGAPYDRFASLPSNAKFDAKLTGEGVKLMERIPDLPVRETYDIDGGVKTYNSGKDSPKVIESTEIVSFECEFSLIAAVLEEESELSGRIYTLDAEPDGGTVKCKIDWYGRESSSVPREFMADASFMKKIQTIAEKYDFAQHNGYESVVSGLPHMYGAKLDIKYASGECIYAYDNQDCFISLDAMNELVELFSSYTMEYPKVSENDPEKPIEPENPQTTEKPAETDTPTQTEKPQETPMMSFVDVVKGQYYYDAVMWAANEGITGGTSANTFSPNSNCSRAQVVTFLHRMIASPEPALITLPFTDVSSSDYFYKPIKWAFGSEITGGTSATTFSPDSHCSRAQVVTFLWRTTGQPEPTGKNNPFTDVKADSYYYDAVLWAVENGITGGTSANTFSPDDSCTRAQVVTFLYRFINGQ